MPRPVSKRRLAANRQNARKSTGPRTPTGKARSARNSLKHALLSYLSAYSSFTLHPPPSRSLGIKKKVAKRTQESPLATPKTPIRVQERTQNEPNRTQKKTQKHPNEPKTNPNEPNLPQGGVPPRRD